MLSDPSLSFENLASVRFDTGAGCKPNFFLFCVCPQAGREARACISLKRKRRCSSLRRPAAQRESLIGSVVSSRRFERCRGLERRRGSEVRTTTRRLLRGTDMMMQISLSLVYGVGSGVRPPAMEWRGGLVDCSCSLVLTSVSRVEPGVVVGTAV